MPADSICCNTKQAVFLIAVIFLHNYYQLNSHQIILFIDVFLLLVVVVVPIAAVVTCFHAIGQPEEYMSDVGWFVVVKSFGHCVQVELSVCATHCGSSSA